MKLRDLLKKCNGKIFKIILKTKKTHMYIIKNTKKMSPLIKMSTKPLIYLIYNRLDLTIVYILFRLTTLFFVRFF